MVYLSTPCCSLFSLYIYAIEYYIISRQTILYPPMNRMRGFSDLGLHSRKTIPSHYAVQSGF